MATIQLAFFHSEYLNEQQQQQRCAFAVLQSRSLTIFACLFVCCCFFLHFFLFLKKWRQDLVKIFIFFSIFIIKSGVPVPAAPIAGTGCSSSGTRGWSCYSSSCTVSPPGCESSRRRSPLAWRTEVSERQREQPVSDNGTFGESICLN